MSAVERTALDRAYSTDRSGSLSVAVNDIYPQRMPSWRYLGTGGSCHCFGPGVSYRHVDRDPSGLVVLEVEVEWEAADLLVPTALYRLYDEADILLYIGISTNPRKRFAQHSIYKAWWPSVARIRVAWMEVTRPEALAIEAAAIRVEEPLHNGKHNGRAAPFHPDAWPRVEAPTRQKASTLAGLIRTEVESGRWLSGMRIPESEVVAAASGVSLGTANRAYGYLKRDGVLIARVGHGTFVR